MLENISTVFNYLDRVINQGCITKNTTVEELQNLMLSTWNKNMLSKNCDMEDIEKCLQKYN